MQQQLPAGDAMTGDGVGVAVGSAMGDGLRALGAAVRDGAGRVGVGQWMIPRVGKGTVTRRVAGGRGRGGVRLVQLQLQRQCSPLARCSPPDASPAQPAASRPADFKLLFGRAADKFSDVQATQVAITEAAARDGQLQGRGCHNTGWHGAGDMCSLKEGHYTHTVDDACLETCPATKAAVRMQEAAQKVVGKPVCAWLPAPQTVWGGMVAAAELQPARTRSARPSTRRATCVKIVQFPAFLLCNTPWHGARPASP